MTARIGSQARRVLGFDRLYSFLAGQSAEPIAQAFPVLSLEQVYGAITYYLDHRDEVDRDLEGRRRDFAAARQATRDAEPMFYQKLADAKKHCR